MAPFGFPVVPLVYRMKSGCSESTATAGNVIGAARVHLVIDRLGRHVAIDAVGRIRDHIVGEPQQGVATVTHDRSRDARYDRSQRVGVILVDDGQRAPSVFRDVLPLLGSEPEVEGHRYHSGP
jgi:hypothetical protein